MDVKMYNTEGERLAHVENVLACTTDGAAHATVEFLTVNLAQYKEGNLDSKYMIVVVDDGSGVDDIFEAFASVTDDDGERYVGAFVNKIGYGIAGTMYPLA